MELGEWRGREYVEGVVGGTCNQNIIDIKKNEHIWPTRTKCFPRQVNSMSHLDILETQIHLFGFLVEK